jgi:hypothetical protein
MLVSNFELLIARIAPAVSGAVARRAVQGHFLTISNTELDRAVYFSVRYVCYNAPAPATDVDVNRELNIGVNVSLIYDGNGQNNTNIPAAQVITAFGQGGNLGGPSTALGIRGYTFVQTRNLRLLAGETGLLALLPALTPPVLLNPNPQLEIRGYIEIQQENNAFVAGAGTQLQTNPFVNHPARLLINSEHRGTFLDPTFTGAAVGVFDFDQLAYSLPLAEGRSLYVLPGTN